MNKKKLNKSMLVWAPEWKVFREVHRPLIVAEGMSYYQFLRTEVPKLFHRNHLQCKSIRARCLLHVRGPVHHRRKYTSSHLRASVQRVRKTQCLKGPPPHAVHYLRKHALPPSCMYYNLPPTSLNQTHAQNKYEACRTPAPPCP